jgi:hypothetical protein
MNNGHRTTSDRMKDANSLKTLAGPFRRLCVPSLLALALLPPVAGSAGAAAIISFGLTAPPPLVAIPASPVTYAPSVAGNYFFYGGGYYAFAGDGWYSSAGYNGPWIAVPPALVPPPILAVPVAYYRHPPPHWAAWERERPPHWGVAYGRPPEPRYGHGGPPGYHGRHDEHRG